LRLCIGAFGHTAVRHAVEAALLGVTIAIAELPGICIAAFGEADGKRAPQEVGTLAPAPPCKACSGRNKVLLEGAVALVTPAPVEVMIFSRHSKKCGKDVDAS